MNRIHLYGVCLAFLITLSTACSALPAFVPPTSTPPPTVPPTVVSTFTPRPTDRPTATAVLPSPSPTVTLSGVLVAVQMPDNIVRLYDLSGKNNELTKLAVRLSPLNMNDTSNSIGDSIYASSLASSASSIARVDSQGAHALVALQNPLSGVAVGGGRVAWGRYAISGTIAMTELFVGGPDGSQAKSIAKRSYSAPTGARALTPFQWSGDGSRLYYSYEPVGLGGYILFGGSSNLTGYTPTDGKSVELIKDKAAGGLVCIDDVSPNDKLVSYHCSQKGIGIMDIKTGKSTIVQLPTGLGTIKALGNARFAPDSSRVAFAAAKNDPSDEQGWVLVSTGLTGTSRMVAKSPAKDYYEMLAWVGSDRLLLQTHNPEPALWTVKIDGTGLRKLADGQFLSLLEGRK